MGKPPKFPQASFLLISHRIKTNYFDLFIRSIDTETTGYEIELSNDQDLIFNDSGEFVCLDN